MSHKLQVVMPMAGLGSRFSKAGFTTPKPLIPVDGKPMFIKALDSLTKLPINRYIIVIRQEHAEAYQLDSLIKKALPAAKVVVIPQLTRGAAETVLMATPELDPDAGLIALDCDLWFSSRAYEQMVDSALSWQHEIVGGLLTFASNHPRYSYAEVDAAGNVTRTAEKQVISNRAILGGYFFTTAATFIDTASKYLASPLPEDLKEYYLSHVYNLLLEEGATVKSASVDTFHSFGTPEELQAYENQ